MTPIVSFLSTALFKFQFRDFLILHGINLNEKSSYISLFSSAEFQSHFSNNASSFLLGYIAPLLLTQILITGCYFVILWHKKGWTIGKLILGLRILDKTSLKPPSVGQSIARFVSYSIGFIGIWTIPFTEQKQAVHDKIADTIVIKS